MYCKLGLQLLSLPGSSKKELISNFISVRTRFFLELMLLILDSLPLRQKRHKYIKRKAHTVNVVDKKDGVATTLSGLVTTAGANRKCK
jgi:hypothetical protein